MSESKILLGFEVSSGKPVHIPLHHLVITGMTQLSGKTTTIEALIHRSGLRAIVFKTKRGEKGFETAGRTLPLYFKERSDWRYVSSLIEATLRERVKFERSWVIRACKGTHTLREVYNRVVKFLQSKKLRSLDRSVFTNLQAYLDLILPEMERLPTTDSLEIGPGVNVMDLEAVYHRPEVQALVIRSVMEHILEVERNIIVVVPECWKFLPQTRNTPVKIFFERFIREGATIGNYLWLDSQDIAGVDKTPLRQVDNWILGRQREEHEVDRTLEAIPLPKGQKPTSLEIRRLKLGHFYAACGDQVKLVYVLPAEISEDVGQKVARGEISAQHVESMLSDLRLHKEVDEDLVWKEKYEKLKVDYDEVKKELGVILKNTKELEKKMDILRELKEWKAKYGGKFQEDKQKLEANVKDLTKRLRKAEGDLKVLREFREVLRKLILGIPTVIHGKEIEVPSELSVDVQQPRISVKVKRETLVLSDKDLLGKIAILYSEGVLSGKWFSVSDVIKGFKTHAWNQDPRISKVLNEMTQWGFFTRKMAGRKPIYKELLTPDQARAKGLLKIEEKG